MGVVMLAVVVGMLLAGFCPMVVIAMSMIVIVRMLVVVVVMLLAVVVVVVVMVVIVVVSVTCSCFAGELPQRHGADGDQNQKGNPTARTYR